MLDSVWSGCSVSLLLTDGAPAREEGDEMGWVHSAPLALCGFGERERIAIPAALGAV